MKQWLLETSRDLCRGESFALLILMAREATILAMPHWKPWEVWMSCLLGERLTTTHWKEFFSAWTFLKGIFLVTPIPCSYTCSPLDGIARIFLFFYMDIQDYAIYHVWIHLFPISYARGGKPVGLELETNPGPLASRATTLTTRPCCLGLLKGSWFGWSGRASAFGS